MIKDNIKLEPQIKPFWNITPYFIKISDFSIHPYPLFYSNPQFFQKFFIHHNREKTQTQTQPTLHDLLKYHITKEHVQLIINIIRDDQLRLNDGIIDIALFSLELLSNFVTFDDICNILIIFQHIDDVKDDGKLYTWQEYFESCFVKFGKKSLYPLYLYVKNKKKNNGSESRIIALNIFVEVVKKLEMENDKLIKKMYMDMLNDNKDETKEFNGWLVYGVYQMKMKEGLEIIKKMSKWKNFDVDFVGDYENILLHVAPERIKNETGISLCQHCRKPQVVCDKELNEFRRKKKEDSIKMAKKYFQEKDYKKTIQYCNEFQTYGGFTRKEIFHLKCISYYHLQKYSSSLFYYYYMVGKLGLGGNGSKYVDTKLQNELEEKVLKQQLLIEDKDIKKDYWKQYNWVAFKNDFRKIKFLPHEHQGCPDIHIPGWFNDVNQYFVYNSTCHHIDVLDLKSHKDFAQLDLHASLSNIFVTNPPDIHDPFIVYTLGRRDWKVKEFIIDKRTLQLKQTGNMAHYHSMNTDIATNFTSYPNFIRINDNFIVIASLYQIRIYSKIDHKFVHSIKGFRLIRWICVDDFSIVVIGRKTLCVEFNLKDFTITRHYIRNDTLDISKEGKYIDPFFLGVNENYVVSSYQDFCVVIFSRKTGLEKHKIKFNDEHAQQIYVQPKTDFVIFGFEGKFRIFDCFSGKKLFEKRVCNESIYRCRMNCDSDMNLIIKTASVDGIISIQKIKYEKKYCNVCGKKNYVQKRGEKILKICSRCKLVHYCSKECQLIDWKSGHKKICKKS